MLYIGNIRGYCQWLTAVSRHCVTRPELSENVGCCQRWNWRSKGEDLQNRVNKHSKKLMALVTWKMSKQSKMLRFR